MADYQTARAQTGIHTAAGIDEGLRAHMSKVYGTMSVGMLVTAGVSWAVGNTPALMAILRDTATGQMTILGWVVMFAPLIFIFGFNAMINRVSAAGAQALFYVFAALMGLSISWIFAAFTGISIAQTFLVTSISFAGLSLWGYTTKKDISGWGAFLMMGLIGLIVAMIMNIVLISFFGVVMPGLQFAIPFIGILIFAGLTAYDTQRLKTEYIAHAQYADQEWLDKSGIMGALSLYLNFINIFMFLLSFMGNRE